MEENWKKAERILEKANRGEMKITKKQKERLESLIEGHKAQIEADYEQRKGLIGLMYERHVYQSKLVLIEKLGFSNKWKHPLLNFCKEVIYQSSETFQLSDFMGK